MTARALGDGYELDDDPARVDVDVVHRFLAFESYWALGRSREVVAGSIAGSQRVVGLYHNGEMVGFARVISDGAALAHLQDVFVLQAHRGRGLGVELVRETVEHGPYSELGWGLLTDDAQSLYTKFGFLAHAAEVTAMRRAPNLRAARSDPRQASRRSADRSAHASP